MVVAGDLSFGVIAPDSVQVVQCDLAVCGDNRIFPVVKGVCAGDIFRSPFQLG